MRNTRPDHQLDRRAGSARPLVGRVGQTLVACWPLSFVLIGYALAGWVNGGLPGLVSDGQANRWGFPVHVVWPGRVDTSVFDVLPSAWLQHHLYRPGEVRWYDVVVAVVYTSHYVAAPVISAVLWFADRRRFRAWMSCVVALAVLGVTSYIVFPMAPPWLAGRTGDGPTVSRLTTVGWDRLHLPVVSELVGGGQGVANPVAAMPSLHAAYAALVALFFLAGAAWWVRLLLLGYPLLMGLVLVYAGEHYVIDVVVGWLCAGLVVGGSVWLRRMGKRRNPAETVGAVSDTGGRRLVPAA